MKRRSGLYEGLQGLFANAFGPNESYESINSNDIDVKKTKTTTPTTKEIEKKKFNNPNFKVQEEEIDTERTLRSRIPTMYMKPNQQKKQRIVIIKMFEKGTNYSKIIPRTISFLSQKRSKYLKPGEKLNISEIEVEILIKLMRQDDPWLEEVSPITTIRMLDEKSKKLIDVTGKEVLKISDLEETCFSFFVKRENGYRGKDEFKIFDSFKEAIKFVKKYSQQPNSNVCRYYDLYHHGYTIIDPEVEFPVYRAGTSLVKILFQEKEIFIPEKKETKKIEVASEEDVVIEECKFDIEYNKKQSFLEVYEFSKYVNPKLIPLKDHECTLETEKVRIVTWKKIKQLPKTRNELQKLKKYTDLGIPPKLRREIYFVATETVPDEKEYENIFKRVFETYYPIDFKRKDVNPEIFPTFGGDFKPDFYYLNEEGSKAAKRILCVLAFHNGELQYCPRIVHICCLLLSVMEEFECYQVINNMLKLSKDTNFYMRTNIYENAIHFYSFDKMIEKYESKISTHLKNIHYDYLELHKKWYNDFCHEIVPYRNLLGIFDRYMVEGLNELCQSAYSVFKSNEKTILTLKTAEEVSQFLRTRTPAETDVFKYKVTGNFKAFEPQVKPYVDKLIFNAKFDRYSRPVILEPSKIIDNPNHWEYLCHNLPYGQRLKKLSMFYTTKKDGYNLGNIYSHAKNVGPMIILIEAKPIDPNAQSEVVQDVRSHILGVYCGEEINFSNSYEGTTDTMVFSLKPEHKSFRWTKKNDYFSLGKENTLSFGGGGDGPAITLDSDLYRGSSFSCETFDNEPLCGKFNDFLVSSIEIYKFKL
eukprot:gene500-8014_t